MRSLIDGLLALRTESTRRDLAAAVETSSAQHACDLEWCAGWVELPPASARKPTGAGRSISWQWVFAATGTYRHRETGAIRRRHLHANVIQRAAREAVLCAGIRKQASCHTPRHSFAMHVLGDGQDIRTNQELLGHKGVSRAMIYTHVLNRGPLDRQAGP